MAMTMNPNAGQSAPDTFRDEGLHAFRFDLDGDARENYPSRCASERPSTPMTKIQLTRKF
jgi:hypothetical protein